MDTTPALSRLTSGAFVPHPLPFVYAQTRIDHMTDTQSGVQRFVSGNMSPDEISEWLTGFRFRDPVRAHARISDIARRLASHVEPKGFLSSLLTGLTEAAKPDHVLTQIERFLPQLGDDPELLRLIAADQRQAEMLVTIFAGSQYLADILLARPASFRGLVQSLSETRPYSRIEVRRTIPEFHQMAQEAAAQGRSFEDKLTHLCMFHRNEQLRIGACDLLGLWDLPAVTRQLSNLADGLVREALELASRDTSIVAGGFVVLALGKLGGRELNYSSDIDLLFLAASRPAEYNRLAIRLMDVLRTSTSEGFLYRVDMRLRPWGRMGPLVSSTGGYLKYIRDEARLWEKQALLKARVVAGHRYVGEQLLGDVQRLIFQSDPGQVKLDVRRMKEKIEHELAKKGRHWGEVKLGKGSIRDIEFVTQYLQVTRGGEYESVQSPQTLDALNRLYRAGILPLQQYRVLSDGYTFLRAVEHHLQLMHYRQTHTLPKDEQELAHLARRLKFSGKDAAQQFVSRYEQHSGAVRSVYLYYLGEAPGTETARSETPIEPHIERLAPAYALTFETSDIERHAELADMLTADNLVELVPEPLENDFWRLTVVAYDYLGAFSAICGLLFAHGFDIHGGQIFSYEPDDSAGDGSGQEMSKIVDVLTVRPVSGQVTSETWNAYGYDLAALMAMLDEGDLHAAQGALVRRVAGKVRPAEPQQVKLSPVHLEIDNESSEGQTVLSIDAVDSTGFLYELTNALALNRINIIRMTVESVGDRVRDTLYVTDEHGRKITDSKAQRRLRSATVLVKHFTHLLPSSPDPESALLHFRALLSKLFREDKWLSEITSLERPEVLDALTQLLGVSDFLWEDFLRLQYENLFPVVQDAEGLETQKTRQDFVEELRDALASAGSPDECRRTLNAFKDREMFRIDMRYILRRLQEFGRFSVELTDLAEAVIEKTLRFCKDELVEIYGEPLIEDGRPSDISVCALGKCGGRELGFASDIELMFVYAGTGETSGPNKITTTEFYNLLVRRVSEAIESKREGIFEIDLQLRPYGRAGNLAVSIRAYERYFSQGGAAWPYERQMLIKLRPIAGDTALGRRLQSIRDTIIDHIGPFDVAAMRAMRERQVRHLVAPGTTNAKFGPGGLVDLEYLVQGLQISYHRRHPELHGLTNTREALAALRDVGVLSWEDHHQLDGALVFHRRLIDALRMVRGHAKDLTIPPNDTADFTFLALRLGYASDHSRLGEDVVFWMRTVQELQKRLL